MKNTWPAINGYSFNYMTFISGIATASFITLNTSHISLRSGLSACNNCVSPNVPPSDRLVALNLIQSFVEPLDMIEV